MDNYNIHVNLRITKVGNETVSLTKERLWRPLLSFNTWVLKGITMPGFMYDGLGLTLIMNTAVITEGVIADIIDEYSLNAGLISDWGENINRATWASKKEKFNSLFEKKLESYRAIVQLKPYSFSETT